MTNADAFPWPEMVAMILAFLILLGFVKLVMKIMEWVLSARDGLRYRFDGGSWHPSGIDILLVPIWLALEVLCFVGRVLLVLLIAAMAYQTAKDVRDWWWHSGGNRRD